MSRCEPSNALFEKRDCRKVIGFADPRNRDENALFKGTMAQMRTKVHTDRFAQARVSNARRAVIKRTGKQAERIVRIISSNRLHFSEDVEWGYIES